MFSRKTAAVVGCILALALGITPAVAFANVSRTDSVAGVSLSEHKVPVTAAPNIDAAAGTLMTYDGKQLWARRADDQLPMASTTKLMTTLLTFEKGHLDDHVTISNDGAQTPYGIGLKAGDHYSVRQLLQLALVDSSNDAAYTLGEHTGGNMRTFVKMMNDRARQLGLTHTRYVNPHGLDAPGHYSSATDLAKLAKIDMGIRDFRDIVAMRQVSATVGGQRQTLNSTDKLLGSYPGANGVKTGYTGNAGYCFVASAWRNGVGLIAVVMGTPSNNDRFSQAARLLDWGFKHTSTRSFPAASEAAPAVRAVDHPDVTVPLRFVGSMSESVFDVGLPMSVEASIPTQTTLPVFEGQPFGEVTWKQGDRVIARLPVVANSSIASLVETVGAVPVADFVDRVVPVLTAKAVPVSGFDPKGVPVQKRVAVRHEVTAPVRKGQRLGEIAYLQAGRVIVRVPVVAAATVPAPGFLERLGISLQRGWRTLFGGRQMAALSLQQR